jgi:Uma2 family endonuclease
MTPPSPDLPFAPDDPEFPYGWRHAVGTGPDGQPVLRKQPLTPEDVLHPQDGDHIAEGPAHDADRSYLVKGLRARYHSLPGALVLCECPITWDVPGLRPHRPDVALVLGVRRMQACWNNFDVAGEGVRPALLIEVVSPCTREADAQVKLDHYHRAGVPCYVLVDREEAGRPTVRGYRWMPDRYADLPLEGGWLALGATGLWLGTSGDRLVLSDHPGGEDAPDYLDLTRALQAARQEISEERARADAEARGRAAAERAAAMAEARAEHAERLARAESETVARLEARLRELEAGHDRRTPDETT